jgi:hypothetical protein
LRSRDLEISKFQIFEISVFFEFMGFSPLYSRGYIYTPEYTLIETYIKDVNNYTYRRELKAQRRK